MRIEEHVAALRREGGLMAGAVERVTERPGGWDGRVPTCPDWTIRELTRHLGRTHRWAAAIVGQARTEPTTEEEAELTWGEMPDDDALVAWYRESNRRLVEALESAPADLVCWSFLPAPSPLAFWARRQAHETAIHRADAQSATGAVDGVAADVAVDGVAADFAVDGVDELLLCFFSGRGRRLRAEAPRTLAVTAVDADAAWVVHIGPDGARAERGTGPADCELSGPANDLYLALWNRRPLDGLETRGDVSLMDLWREKATVRWS